MWQRIRPYLLIVPLILAFGTAIAQPSVSGFVAASSHGTIVLNWDHYAGSTEYKLYWGTTPGLGLGGTEVTLSPITVTWVHTGVTPGVTYYYTIRANDVGQTSGYTVLTSEIQGVALTEEIFGGGEADGFSTAINCPSTLDGTTVEYPVSGLSASAGADQNVIYWDFLQGASTYTLEWATASTGPFSVLATVSDLSYTHTGLTAGTAYYYRVKPDFSGGCATAYSDTVTATPIAQNFFGGGEADGFSVYTTCPSELDGTIYEPAPTGLQVAAGMEQAALYWDHLQSASLYYIHVSTDTTVGYTVLDSTIDVSYIHTTLTAGVTYYYRLTASLGAGCSASLGPWVAVTPLSQSNLFFGGGDADGFSVYTSCPMDLDGNSVANAPQNLTVAASNLQNVIYWDFMLEAITYTLKWSTSPTGPFTDITGITDISYVHTGLTAGVTYYYRITAYTGGCPAGTSPVQSATPVAESYIAGGEADGFSVYTSCPLDLDGGSVANAPQNLTVAASNLQNVIYWDFMLEAITYTLQWSTSPTGPFTDITGITDVSYVHTGLSAGVPYYYKITAYTGGCPAGTSPVQSATPVAESTMAGGVADGHAYFVTCPITLDGTDYLRQVQNLSVAASHGNNVVYWDYSQGAESYELQWSDDNFSSFTSVSGITNVSYVHESLPVGVNYDYRVLPTFPGSCQAQLPTAVSSIPVAQSQFVGGDGDGHDMSISCFYMLLSGIAPEVSITGDLILCGTDSVVLTAPTSDTYQWKINGVDIPGAIGQEYVATIEGYYSLDVLNQTGCLAGSALIFVQEGGPSVDSITPMGDATVCAGSVHPYETDSLGSGVTYLWTVPSDAVITGNGHSIQITFGSNSGNITVSAQSICGTTNPGVLPVTVLSSTGKIWTGTIDRDWHIAGNWGCGGVPTTVDDVLIPELPSNQPIIYSNNHGVCNTISLEPNASLIIQTNASLNVNN